MNVLRKILAAVIVFGFLSFNVKAKDSAWLTDFDAASRTASEKGLPLLVLFEGSDWCGWCIRLDKEVFSQKKFSEFAAEGLILFVADFPAREKLPENIMKQNAALKDKYGVKGFPTVILLDSKGSVVGTTGYRQGGAEAYVQHLKDLLK